MRHREIIPTDDQQTGYPNRRVAAQINLRQGHWALQLAGALLNELLAVARQLPDRGDLRWRDEAAP
jgi:hypothetical protein